MSELKTAAAILKNAPKLSDTDIQTINESYSPYMFYKNDAKTDTQHCICSSCRKHFDVSYTQRTVTPADREFLQASHNQQVICPKCGRTVQKKQIGRVKNCATLGDYQRFVFVKRRSEQEVYLIYAYTYKEYRHIYPSRSSVTESVEYDTLPCCEVNAVYYLTPNQQRVFKCSPWSGEWEESKIAEPYTKSWFYNTTAKRGYVLIGSQILKKTFLRYINLDRLSDLYQQIRVENWSAYYWGYVEVPICKIISLFAKYKSFEFLEKQGYDNLIYSMIERQAEAPTLYDWQATTPYKFFKKLSKPEIKALKEKDLCGRSELYLYLRLRTEEQKLSVEDFAAVLEFFPNDTKRFLSVKRKYEISVCEVIKYLLRCNGRRVDPATTGTLWLDYIEAAEYCEYDLSVHNVIFPKKLTTAHDEAVANRQRIIDERNRKSLSERLAEDKERLKNEKNTYAVRYKKLEKIFAFQDNGYCVIVPTGATEIILEGKSLAHCVGGYADRHIRGATTILFIRRIDRKEESLITVEMNEKDLTIIQVHGRGNRPPDKNEQAFIDKWLVDIKHRKNKKSKAA